MKSFAALAVIAATLTGLKAVDKNRPLSDLARVLLTHF
jgi:hypothetical protein